MRRRQFLKHSTALGGATVVGFNQVVRGTEPSSNALSDHAVDRVEFQTVRFNYPRPVGKNGRIGHHGQHKTVPVAKLFTNQGATGWGIAIGNAKQNSKLVEAVVGKSLAELIDPGTGILDGVPKRLDFALHDLAGIILDQPVYQMLGAKGDKANPVYSGMIYLDELEPEDDPAGLDKVIENCRWDVDYGYRQLKVKIGRSGRWYPHDEGLQADIEIVNQIHREFADKNVELLVDANDVYSLQDTIDFLEGVKDVPLYWVEEPFVEDRKKCKELRRWMDSHGFEKTFYADGEREPKFRMCTELYQQSVLDVCLHDINSYGFTKWRKLMPSLVESKTHASPHAWGSRFKTHYCAHLAAGLGNCCTIEGVTCESDDVDFGDYPIKDGKLHVSDAPGFGMKLMV